MPTKKHSSKKHTSAKHVSDKHVSAKHVSAKQHVSAKHLSKHSNHEDGTTMHTWCMQCKKKVDIFDVKKETFKGKGDTLRARLVGKCGEGHKFYRFAKLD
jgi:hypothetical protein